MKLPLNVDVHCTDGRYGQSTRVIINPTTGKVTHVVVKAKTSPVAERMVPVKWVKETTPELILLNHLKEDVNTLDLLDQTDFIQRDVPHYATDPKLTLLWPYVVPAKKIMTETHKTIPPGEFAVRRGTRVDATDGRIGQVDEFLVEPESGYITHLILREGNIWGKNLVTIPIDQIAQIEEDIVHLKMDKKTVKELPSIPVRGWGR